MSSSHLIYFISPVRWQERVCNNPNNPWSFLEANAIAVFILQSQLLPSTLTTWHTLNMFSLRYEQLLTPRLALCLQLHRDYDRKLSMLSQRGDALFEKKRKLAGLSRLLHYVLRSQPQNCRNPSTMTMQVFRDMLCFPLPLNLKLEMFMF